MRKNKVITVLTFQLLLYTHCLRVGSERSICKYEARYELYHVSSDLSSCSMAIAYKAAYPPNAFNQTERLKRESDANTLLLNCALYYSKIRKCESKSIYVPDTN